MKSRLTQKRRILYFVLKLGASTSTMTTIAVVTIIVVVENDVVVRKGRLREGKGLARRHTASQRARQVQPWPPDPQSPFFLLPSSSHWSLPPLSPSRLELGFPLQEVTLKHLRPVSY